MKKLARLLSVTTVAVSLLNACAAPSEPAEAYRDETPQQIYQHGKKALQDKNYGEAIKRFEALDIQYPMGAETENAELYIIYAYYKKEEYTMASSAADQFIHTYPTAAHVDYAYYMRAMSEYYQNMGVLERFFAVDLATRDLVQIQKSYNDFSSLVAHFPHSPYAAPARQYMIYLRNILADHELKIAQYYYDHHAYVASANRAGDVVAHYQGAPAIVRALDLLAKSYHQLGSTKLEQDTVKVLKYNYPDYNYNPV